MLINNDLPQKDIEYINEEQWNNKSGTISKLNSEDVLDTLNTQLEDPTISHFDNSISLDSQRYEIMLPWRSGLHLTDNFYFISKKRLQSIITSLSKSNMFEQYNNVIKTYLEKDYIEKCERSDIECFIPHHAVVKADRTTTKLRIVFDGSAKTNKS